MPMIKNLKENKTVYMEGFGAGKGKGKMKSV